MQAVRSLAPYNFRTSLTIAYSFAKQACITRSIHQSIQYFRALQPVTTARMAFIATLHHLG